MDNESGSFLKDLPDNWHVEETMTRPVESIANLADEVAFQLSNPLASLPLVDLCGPATRVTIVIDRSPEHGARAQLLHGVLTQLESAGVAANRITLLIAASHPHKVSIEIPVLTGAYASHIHVLPHDPEDLSEFDTLGSVEGVPLTVNFRASSADLLIAISLMRLTDDAFDIGSSATITRGLMSTATERELRSSRFLDDHADPAYFAQTNEQKRPLIERVMREGARRAGLVFAVDGLEDGNERILAIRAGSPNAINDALVQVVTDMRDAPTQASSYDVILADAGLDKSLYELSDAAINIGLASNSVLMRGGSMILPINMTDNAIDDSEEAQAFYDAMTNAPTPDLVIQQLQGRSLKRGEDRAYLLAHVMQRHHIIAAGPQREQLVRTSHFVSSPSVRDAAELAESFAGKRPRALVVHTQGWAVPTFSGGTWRVNPITDDVDRRDPNDLNDLDDVFEFLRSRE